jgi:AraC-like DNA-binding protein
MHCHGNLDDFQRANCPVTIFSAELKAHTTTPMHSHLRAQLVYASKGVLSIDTGHHQWVIPPSRAVWITPGTQHAISCLTDVSICTLYVSDMPGLALPETCCSVPVSPLLKEIISRLASLPTDYESGSPKARLIQSAMDEIRALPTVPGLVPLPDDRRLKKICTRLMDDPGCDEPIEQLARQAGLSARHLIRLFQQETGMQFGMWRMHLRLMAALPHLAVGAPVSTVSHTVGYKSAAAFSTNFKRIFGVSPSQYFA